MRAGRLQHLAGMGRSSPAVFKVCRISESHGHCAFCGASFEAQITGSKITKLKRTRARSSNGLTKASGILMENWV